MSDKTVWLEHEFTVYDPEASNWNEVGCLYVFVDLVSGPRGPYKKRAEISN